MRRLLTLTALCALATPLAAQTTGAPAEANASVANADIAGVWDYIAESPGGGDTGQFTITGEPGAFEGQIVAQGSVIPISDVTVDGDALSFTFPFGEGILVTMSGTITNGQFDGVADAGGFGAFPMTATRQAE